MCGLFSKKEKVEPKYLIALIGMTGAGKSTFISKASGRKDIQISNSSSSCAYSFSCVAIPKLTTAGTKDIQAVSFKYKGSQVTLIDTPGFDDTNRSDAEILQTIALFLSGSAEAGLPLTGVIFLQSVLTIRMQGSEKTRIRLIEKILGEDAFPNLVLATTQWSHLKTPKEGDALVEERSSQDDFLGMHD